MILAFLLFFQYYRLPPMPDEGSLVPVHIQILKEHHCPVCAEMHTYLDSLKVWMDTAGVKKIKLEMDFLKNEGVANDSTGSN